MGVDRMRPDSADDTERNFFAAVAMRSCSGQKFAQDAANWPAYTLPIAVPCVGSVKRLHRVFVAGEAANQQAGLPGQARFVRHAHGQSENLKFVQDAGAWRGVCVARISLISPAISAPGAPGYSMKPVRCAVGIGPF